MGWLEWVALVATVIGVFILWDVVFCGGQYCKRFIGRE